MTTETEFFSAVCRWLLWEPTSWRLAVFAEWHRYEGMPLETTWNPLATTRLSPNTPLNLHYDIGHGPGNWNSVPVRVYASPEAGEIATAETLSLSYYPNVRRCFQDETGYPEAVSELATYVGSVAYGQALVNFMNSLPKPEDDSMDTSTINEALQKRMALSRIAYTLLTRANDPDIIIVENNLEALAAAGFRP